MITYFYKILYKNKDVVYVGVTTTTIQKRFSQHVYSKNLNPKLYSVIEFDRIYHNNIISIEDYKKERQKVAELERKYIAEEKSKGSNLLNISIGGEWGSKILFDILKEKFFEIYGSYDGYKKWVKKEINKKIKTKKWLINWFLNTSQPEFKKWLRHWIQHKSSNKTKGWVQRWISCFKDNKTKGWMRHWISHRKDNKTKGWIQHWIFHRTENKTKTWVNNWIYNQSGNKIKKWLNSWIKYKKNK